MIEAPDFLRRAMEAAGVDVRSVEEEAARVDLDELERQQVLADEARRNARALAADNPDDLGIPALPSPDEPAPGLFHTTPSGGEQAAAAAQFPKSGTDRRRVLDHLAVCGDDGATDEEISMALSMRLYTAAPRRNELVTEGWVVDSGRRRPTTTGSAAAVWTLSPLGRASWRPA